MPQSVPARVLFSMGLPVFHRVPALFRQQVRQHIPQCHGSDVPATDLPEQAHCNIGDGCNVAHGFREVEIGVVERDRDAIRLPAHRHILLGEGVCTDANGFELLCLYAQVSDFRHLRDHCVSFLRKDCRFRSANFCAMAYDIFEKRFFGGLGRRFHLYIGYTLSDENAIFRFEN